MLLKIIIYSILDEKLRISISLSVREIYGKFGVKNILQERIKNLDCELNKYMENPLAKYLDVNFF